MKTLAAVLLSAQLIVATGAPQRTGSYGGQSSPKAVGGTYGDQSQLPVPPIKPELEEMQRPSLQAYGQVFGNLRNKTQKLSGKIGGTEPEIARLLATVQTNVAFLEERWLQWSRTNFHRAFQNPSRDPYLLSLNRDYELLGRVEKEINKLVKLRKVASLSRIREADASPVLGRFTRVVSDATPRTWELAKTKETPSEVRGLILKLLGSLSADLQTKADHCRHSPGGLGRTVKVIVRTKQSGVEVPGYEVWFVPYGFLDMKKDKQDRFRQQSSPTDARELAPGRYAFWLRKDRKDLEAEALNIGGDGEASPPPVELEVPR